MPFRVPKYHADLSLRVPFNPQVKNSSVDMTELLDSLLRFNLAVCITAHYVA
jgi:hypothetical protein